MATTKYTTTTTTNQSQSQRCNLSSSSSSSSSPALVEPKAKATSMDPTVLKKHTKSKTITPLTPPDPIAPSPPSSTIQNISNRFAKLYATHKILASLKGSSPGHSVSSHPHYVIQEKGLNNSTDLLALDSSCIALTKSNSQHGRTADLGKESTCTRTKVKGKDDKYCSVVNVKKQPHHHRHQDVDVHVEKALLARKNFNEVKKSSSSAAKKEKKKNKEFDDEKDVKKASSLMSKSLELDKFNRVCEMKRPSMSLAVNGGGGRRKSFCCSQTELADFFSRTGVRVVAVDMPPFMQIHAVNSARKACDSLEKFTSKTLAFTLKKEFDVAHGPAWHCIVGTSFGSFVTHSVGGFMYFSMDHKLHVLLFKTTVERAD